MQEVAEEEQNRDLLLTGDLGAHKALKGHRPATTPASPMKLAMNQAIEARRNGVRFSPAKIKSMRDDGSVTVCFEDGSEE